MRGPPRRKRMHRGASLVLALILCSSLAIRLSIAGVTEYDLKAALIYKIGKFVRWPEGAFQGHGGTLQMCIVGQDDFGSSLESLQGQRLAGQSIAIQRFPSGWPDSTCNIVFISRSERERLAALLTSMAHMPVLTVSDIEDFAAQGGMVGLKTIGSKVRFEINPAAGKSAGLELGAQLLQLATLVADHSGEQQP